MGWLNINGNWIGRHSGKSWSSYWSHQSDVLFFAETKNVVAGKLYNKVSGRTAEYLTLTGSAGSEVYTCPDTADYQTADTDRLWFLPSTTQLNVKTADLIAYDFTRTIVKYTSVAPYTIEAIAILSADISASLVDRLHKDFLLSLYWSGVYNDSGVLKDNKPATNRCLWNLPKTITGLLWWRSAKVPESINLTGDLVNQWEDISENLNHILKISDATRPSFDSVNESIVFTAAGDTSLRLATLVVNQPFTKIIVYKKTVDFDVATYICGSATNPGGLIGTSTSGTGAFIAYSGTPLTQGLNDANTNIHIVEFNGANTKYWLNDVAVFTGNAGANNMDGDEIGSYNNSTANSNCEVMEYLCYSGALSDGNRILLKEYLQAKYGL
jgi:hypothetical protein